MTAQAPTTLSYSCPADVISQFDSPLELLTGAELARLTGFRFGADRESFLAAHLLARVVTGHVLGIRPRDVIIVQHCPRCGGPHGPAQVLGAPDIGVSWSHVRGQVAAIAGHGPVGIDVEAFSADRTMPVQGALTAAEEQSMNASLTPALAFLQLWVRKEALVKVGHITLDTLLTAQLVGQNGGLLEEWQHYAITGWERESFLGAAVYLKGMRLRTVWP